MTRAVRSGRVTVPAHVAEKIDSLMYALVEANDGIEQAAAGHVEVLGAGARSGNLTRVPAGRSSSRNRATRASASAKMTRRLTAVTFLGTNTPTPSPVISRTSLTVPPSVSRMPGASARERMSTRPESSW